MSKRQLASYEQQYRASLFDDVIPFWMTHSPDREYGGFLHSLDHDGSVIDSEKVMWPENREVWVFSMLYNNAEKRSEWLDMAKLGVDFLKKYGRDPNGDWYFVLSREGKPVVQPYNVYSECFVVLAFSEYAKASGDEEALQIAIDAYNSFQARSSNPKGKYNKLVPGGREFRTLTFPMSNVYISTLLNNVTPSDE